MSASPDAQLAASSAVAALGRLIDRMATTGATGPEVHSAAIEAERALRSAAEQLNGVITIALSADAVFVNGGLIRGPRAVTEPALALAELASKLELIEIEAGRMVQHGELLSLASVLVAAAADPRQRDTPFATRFSSLRLTRGDARSEEMSRGSEPARVLYLYASTLTMLRAAHRALLDGSELDVREIKRAALRLATAGASPAWLGLTTLAAAHKDDAGRALQTAIVSVAVARELTRDTSVLTRIAFTALLSDIGRPLLTALAGRSPDVDASLEAHVPAASAAVSFASSGGEAAAWRATVSFESGWREREALLGPLHGAELACSVDAELLTLARAYLDGIAPRDGRAALSPSAALARVQERQDADPAVRALMGYALGPLPPGSVIELASREWAVVIGRSATGNPSRPLVRLVTDRRGHAHSRPIEIDLGAPLSGSQAPGVVGVVPPSRARFNVARTFFGSV